MRALHPFSRLASVVGVLMVLMFCRSLAAAGVGVVCGLACIAMQNGMRSCLKALGLTLPLCVLSALVNPLVSHRGMTVLLFVNDRAYTLEALLFGLELGLSLSGAALWFMVMRSVLDEREMLYLFGRLSPKLALTVSMTLGFIPRMLAKHRRILSAQHGSGLMRDNSISGRMESASAVYLACTSWAAENAAAAAQSMNARCYGMERLTYSDRRKLRKGDAVFLCLYFILVTAIVYFALTGGTDGFYPVYEMSGTGLTVSCAACCLMPVIFIGKERAAWLYCTAKG